jgi:hypothetical protein
MNPSLARRHDDELRTVIHKAFEIRQTSGKSAAIDFLVENYVPTSLIQLILEVAVIPQSLVCA